MSCEFGAKIVSSSRRLSSDMLSYIDSKLYIYIYIYLYPTEAILQRHLQCNISDIRHAGTG